MGSTWEIYYVLEELFLHSLDEIIAKMKREKVAMIADWCFLDVTGERFKVLEKFEKISLQPIMTFDPRQLDTLGQAVNDNILYYDPVEVVYGVQGKSLEWGIKGYFAKT